MFIVPEDYMLSCLWKKTFDVDCLGCGFQRSLLLVFKGEFISAFNMYPAIYTLITMFLFLIMHIRYNFKFGHKVLLGLFILNISIMIISYYIKHF